MGGKKKAEKKKAALIPEETEKPEKAEKTTVRMPEPAPEEQKAAELPARPEPPASGTGAAGAPAKRPGKRKKKIWKRLVIWLIVLGILGLGVYVVIRKLQDDYRVVYDPYTASVGSISNSLSYTGSMQLIRNETHTAPADAKIREVYVAAGQQVKEGDRLIRLSNGTTLTAGFDGKVNRVDVSKGDEVHSGDNLVQVADFNRMQISFRVGESNIRDVAVGQRIRITVPSVGAAFTAEIGSIDYASYSGNNVAYYTATAEVDTSGIDYIYPGMQATVTIPQEEARDVVILKMDAISTSADNSAFVYKQAADGSMAETPVTVGVSNGNYVEIRSGVSDGETVYVIQKQEESTLGGILSGIFGTQRVNAPANRNGGGNFPSGNYTPGNNPGNRNRGN